MKMGKSKGPKFCSTKNGAAGGENGIMQSQKRNVRRIRPSGQIAAQRPGVSAIRPIAGYILVSSM